MKHIWKRIAASALAAAMCLGLAGCYSESKTWAAKMDDVTLPTGGYIYYLSSAYSEAMSKVASGEEVMKAQIDGKDAETWIKDRALAQTKAFFYIESKFKELGLELTEEEQTNAQNNTDSMWTYYKSSMEPMGIAKESYHLAGSLYSAKYRKVMEAMYGEGGEKAIPEDELKTYFTDNYCSYEYFYASLSTTDDDGNKTDMTDDEKKTVKQKLENYVKEINGGDKTVEDAAKEYAGDEDSTYSSIPSIKKTGITETVVNALDGAKDNEAVFADGGSIYYVLRKLSIDDQFDTTKESDTELASLISDMKGEEFRDFVMEQGAAFEGAEINQKAISSIKLSKLINDNNKNGTSSAASSQAEDESSAVSSQAE